jgi:hypothetical protein
MMNLFFTKTAQPESSVLFAGGSARWRAAVKPYGRRHQPVSIGAGSTRFDARTQNLARSLVGDAVFACSTPDTIAIFRPNT